MQDTWQFIPLQAGAGAGDGAARQLPVAPVPVVQFLRLELRLSALSAKYDCRGGNLPFWQMSTVNKVYCWPPLSVSAQTSSSVPSSLIGGQR